MKQQNKDHRRRASRNHNFKIGFRIVPVHQYPVQKTVAPKKDKSFFVIVTLIIVAVLLSILTVYFIKL
jgi:hypothetical protein